MLGSQHEVLIIICRAAHPLILAYRLFAVDNILLQHSVVLLTVIPGFLHALYMVEVSIALYLAAVSQCLCRGF